MSVTTISIPLEGKAAEAYRLAPLEKREWLEMLVNLVVGEFAKYSTQSLLALMDDMSREARKNGLTPEILESLFRVFRSYHQVIFWRNIAYKTDVYH